MAYLDKYSGNWTETEARHLLVRTTFGPSKELINTATGLGMDQTLVKLFEDKPLPSPPVKYIPDGSGQNELDDPGAKFGETWVNAEPYPDVSTSMLRNRILSSRRNSLYAWTLLQMHDSVISVQDKLTLFWHNHFVVGQTTIPHRAYIYHMLLRKHALGNFKQLTKDITIDTSMLIYLSGAANTDQAPNENYSRELLELFTVGKGELIGPGDYSNYTEQDVVEMAKILTGWRFTPVTNPDTLTAYFSNVRHTKGNKYLSRHFGNSVIAENGEDEYKDMIDVIFGNDECSRFIMRKLYRWFVNSAITEEIEVNIIKPLAQIIRDNGYEISPALKVLFASEHFYELTACMIKSPVDLILSALRGLNVSPSGNSVKTDYDYTYALFLMCAELEQALYYHPDVAGWKAYYQEPLYYKTWINNLLLPKRLDYCKTFVAGGTISIFGVNYKVSPLVPVLELAAEIDDAEYPDELIRGLSRHLFNYPVSDEQISSLKQILIPGLPDFEWTVEYGKYLQNPDDVNLRNSVENKLRNVLSVMVQMSEFQIM